MVALFACTTMILLWANNLILADAWFTSQPATTKSFIIADRMNSNQSCVGFLRVLRLHALPDNNGDDNNDDDDRSKIPPSIPGLGSSYNLGAGKNKPFVKSNDEDNDKGKDADNLHWYAPKPVKKPLRKVVRSLQPTRSVLPLKSRRRKVVVPRDEEGRFLKNALWHENHYDDSENKNSNDPVPANQVSANSNDTPAVQISAVSDASPQQPYNANAPPLPHLFYPNIDMSIPDTVYNPEKNIDVVWDLMRWEAFQEAQREPLLVSFLYSTILNHATLESSLASLLANKLKSPAMIATQIQSLILESFRLDPQVPKRVRADILAVRDRDPACTCLPDVFLYFKGFQALQTYRVANALWTVGKKQVLAHYLQSQMSQTFQIDIHPNATLGSGIMLDHGTGIVIGETAHVGHNCSILHHVTLGGSGKKGVDRHPKVGDGVLLGAGASVLGNVKLGYGCQVGAGTLVISDLPAHSVAVGVPAKIIGSFVDVTEQPSIGMNQNVMDSPSIRTEYFDQSDGI